VVSLQGQVELARAPMRWHGQKLLGSEELDDQDFTAQWPRAQVAGSA